MMSAPTAAIPPSDILYSFRRCPYAMRARMAVKLSGANPSVREVDLKAKPAELIAASPKGTVPVLVLQNGGVIEQSLDIMRHVLAGHDPLGLLKGDTAAVRALIAENDGPFKAALDRYKYPNRFADEDITAAQEGCAAFYARLEDALLTGRAETATGFTAEDGAEGRTADGGAADEKGRSCAEPHDSGLFLTGAKMGLADLAIFPFIRQAAFVNPAAFGALPYPRVQAWLERMMALPAFAAIMKPLPVWQTGTIAPLFQDVFHVNCDACAP